LGKKTTNVSETTKDEFRCAGGEPWDGNYFVATYPPFSTWTAACAQRVRERLASINGSTSSAPLGLYVHIPFCVKRCDYCYYLSYADKTRTQQEQYVAALIEEARTYARSPALKGQSLSFVYFGGGTPSVLEERMIARLLGGLQSQFPWAGVEEASFECAPRAVTASKLRSLRELGVTRISLGVQSLDDAVLRLNGRVHLRKDVEAAYGWIRAAAFDVVNLDLMVGLPGESEASLAATLDAVIEMAPDSVTVYQTEIPHNTPLYRAESAGSLPTPVPNWTAKRARLAQAFARLEEAGYVVRSAYSAVRDPQKHRFVYQDRQYRGADLIGLGVASFSYLSGRHHQNRGSYEAYVAGVAAGELPIDRAYALSDEERLIREFVLQLKLGRLETAYFTEKFGVDVIERFSVPLRCCADRGWLTCDDGGVTLSRDGLLHVDRFLPMFYRSEHRDVRYS